MHPDQRVSPSSGPGTDDLLVAVFVELPSHWSTGGEELLARRLSDDLYELQHSPLYAYALNFLDVVRAIPCPADDRPRVRDVVRRSGHSTLRVFFYESVRLLERVALLDGLAELGVTHTSANPRYVALDIPPATALPAVRARLDEWERSERIQYETCEARIAGSFDDMLDPLMDQPGDE